MATLGALLSRFGLKNLKLSAGFMELEIESNDAIQLAAWELYIELLTRVATQTVEDDEGDAETALKSLYAVFPVTREILRKHGPGCVRLAYIAIPFLNQVLRPFTAKWHTKQLSGELHKQEAEAEFRKDLRRLQKLILGYTGLMASVAGVEEEKLRVENAPNS